MTLAQSTGASHAHLTTPSYSFVVCCRSTNCPALKMQIIPSLCVCVCVCDARIPNSSVDGYDGRGHDRERWCVRGRKPHFRPNIVRVRDLLLAFFLALSLAPSSLYFDL